MRRHDTAHPIPAKAARIERRRQARWERQHFPGGCKLICWGCNDAEEVFYFTSRAAAEAAWSRAALRFALRGTITDEQTPPYTARVDCFFGRELMDIPA